MDGQNVHQDRPARDHGKEKKMTMAMLVDKIEQFCLWFFWNMEWPKEKIITLGVMILVLIIIASIMGRFKKVRPAACTTARPAGERRHWRTN